MSPGRSPVFLFYELETRFDSLIFQKDHFFFAALGFWLALVLVGTFGLVSPTEAYLLLAVFLAFVGALWAFINSRRRKVNGMLGFLYALVVFVFPPAGALMYLCLRPTGVFPKPPPQKGKTVVVPMPVGPVFVPVRTPLGVLLRLIVAAMIVTIFVLCVLAVPGIV
jgi:hypothetical protein